MLPTSYRGSDWPRARIVFYLACILNCIGLIDHATAAVTRRAALVIGNGAYQNAPQLDNAPRDAKAIAEALRKLGFEVIDGYDLDFGQMRSKVSEFSAALARSNSGLVYYAGHGISIDEENYLIPIDVQLQTPADLDFGAINVSVLLKQMKREDRVSIVILDACRDNPFAAALARSATRALVNSRGLSRIEGDLARGTLIAFASDPKSTALDGPPGGHSPFAEALLDHMFDPGISIDTLMTRVRAEVWEKTNHNQLPWVNTSLIGEFVLDSGSSNKAPMSSPPPNDKTQEEYLLWQSAEHSNLRDDYQAYLEVFPNGVFARMAKNRIATLQDKVPSAQAEIAERSASTQSTPKLESLSSSAAKPESALPETASRSEGGQVFPPVQSPAELSPPFDDKLGTVETESTLALTHSDWKEIQLRMRLIGYYSGPENGEVDQLIRSSIEKWQKERHFNPSSFLAPLQLTALKEESESRYQDYLTERSSKVNNTTTRQPVKETPKSKRELPQHSIEIPHGAPKRKIARQPRIEAPPIISPDVTIPPAPTPSLGQKCDLSGIFACRGKRQNSLM